MKSPALLFLTVNNMNGERNPLSVILIEALKKEALKKDQDCTAMVLESVESANDQILKINDGSVVPLFDVEFGINRWSPRPLAVKGIPTKGLPQWVRESSTGSCVAIGPDCVQYPSHIEDCVQQISRMFKKEIHKNGNGNGIDNNYPWGSGPSPNNRRKRRPSRDSNYVRR